MKPITEVAAGLGLTEDELVPYGRHKAKVHVRALDDRQVDAIRLVIQQVPLAGLADIVNDDLFLRTLIPIIVNGKVRDKLRGLELLLKWITANKKKKPVGKKVNLGLNG